MPLTGGEIELRFAHTVVGVPCLANLIKKSLEDKLLRITLSFVILGYFSLVEVGGGSELD